VDKTQHVYRVYVTTFLGFGGNMARQRYEDLVVNSTLASNRYVHTHRHTQGSKLG
jgi:ectonucleoside triphosphate diphosphohydrolase 7